MINYMLFIKSAYIKIVKLFVLNSRSWELILVVPCALRLPASVVSTDSQILKFPWEQLT